MMPPTSAHRGERAAPRGAESGSRLQPGLAWIAANAAGFALGIGVWEVLLPVLRPVVSLPFGGILSIAAFGATLGLCAGLAQWLALLRHHTWVRAWIAVAVAGYAVGFVAGAWASDAITRAFAGGISVYQSDAVEDLTFGALLGLAVGLGRWLVLRRALQSGAARWMLASVVALAVGYSAALGIVLLLPPYPEPLQGAIFGLFTGAITGLVEWLILRPLGRTGVEAA